MRNKSLFSIGLLLAALVTLIGTGPEAQAQTFTINNVRIYVNPDMVAPAEDGTPEFFATATTSTNLIDGRLPKFTDFDAGTLSLEGWCRNHRNERTQQRRPCYSKRWGHHCNRL